MLNKIKELREYLDLTLKEFGEKIGRTHSAIQRYESGKRQPDETTLLLIAQTFNANLEWLKTGEGSMFKDDSQTDTIKKILDNLEKLNEDDLQEILKFSMFKLSDEKYRKKLQSDSA